METHNTKAPQSDLSSFTDLAIGYTDRDLFALYAKYPDINFDPEDFVVIGPGKEDVPGADEHQAALDDFDLSQPSNSTAHPTPLRSSLFLTPKIHDEEVNRYMKLLKNSDLPSETARYLKGLGSRMTVLGRHFVAKRNLPSNPVEPSVILEEFDMLLRDLTCSITNCETEISNIDGIEALASFNLSPPDNVLWTIYRQRALLITRNTSPPSYVERKLLRCLTGIFDTQIYHPFLRDRQAMPFDDEVGIVIDATYDAVMTLSETYLRWWNEVERLIAKYLSPLTSRILSLPEVVKEIQSSQQTFPRSEAQQMSKPTRAQHNQYRSYAAMQAGPFRSRSKYARNATL